MNNLKHKYSVLIPVYNVEKYVSECISSVLKQTLNDFEIIIIDDGSTDSSGRICDEFAKRDPRVIVVHQVNHGLVLARRYAIRLAKGNYCLFLDSDDYWDPNLLESIDSFLSYVDADLVIYRYRNVTESGNLISESPSLFQNKTIFKPSNKVMLFNLLIGSSLLNNVCCKAVKRKIIENEDYSEFKNIKHGEDLLQTISMIYYSDTIIYCDKSMYNYRKSPLSITKTFNRNFFVDITTVRNKLLQYMKILELDDAEHMTVFFQFYLGTMINYVTNVANSNVSKNEKISIISSISNFELYKQSIKYQRDISLSFEQRSVLFLINKNHFETLMLYKKMSSKTRVIIRALKKKKWSNNAE